MTRIIVLLVLFAIICTVSARNCKPKCKPNTHFQNGCDVCFCDENGNVSCAHRSCPIPPPIGDYPVCIPGTTYKPDCNTCTCNENGTGYLCTEIACRESIP